MSESGLETFFLVALELFEEREEAADRELASAKKQGPSDEVTRLEQVLEENRALQDRIRGFLFDPEELLAGRRSDG
jgi:FtsZ-binding cell division protein ZapB